MRNFLDKGRKDEFACAFLRAYLSFGYNIPNDRTAYGKPYTIIELKNSYKITANGKTQRFSSLFRAGEFIYDQCFDISYVRHTPYQSFCSTKLTKVKDSVNIYWQEKLVNCLKGRIETLKMA